MSSKITQNTSFMAKCSKHSSFYTNEQSNILHIPAQQLRQNVATEADKAKTWHFPNPWCFLCLNVTTNQPQYARHNWKCEATLNSNTSAAHETYVFNIMMYPRFAEMSNGDIYWGFWVTWLWSPPIWLVLHPLFPNAPLRSQASC